MSYFSFKRILIADGYSFIQGLLLKINKKYYLTNLINGSIYPVIFIAMTVIRDGYSYFFIAPALIHAILFPFARLFFERMLCKLAPEKFKSFLKGNNNSGRNGFFALYYAIITVCTVPLSFLFAISSLIKSKAT